MQTATLLHFAVACRTPLVFFFPSRLGHAITIAHSLHAMHAVQQNLYPHSFSVAAAAAFMHCGTEPIPNGTRRSEFRRVRTIYRINYTSFPFSHGPKADSCRRGRASPCSPQVQLVVHHHTRMSSLCSPRISMASHLVLHRAARRGGGGRDRQGRWRPGGKRGTAIRGDVIGERVSKGGSSGLWMKRHLKVGRRVGFG